MTDVIALENNYTQELVPLFILLLKIIIIVVQNCVNQVFRRISDTSHNMRD